MIKLTAEEIIRLGAETEREQTLIDFIELSADSEAESSETNQDLLDEIDELRDRLERAKDILDE